MHVLFVFAHQDDEYGALPWIADELGAQNSVSCLYLTDGGSRTAPSIRDAESITVLTGIGVERQKIHFLGTPDRIRDATLIANVTRAHAELHSWMICNGSDVARIYAPAWEGGHPDHDVVAVLTLLEAVTLGIEGDCWNFSIYNGYRCRTFFRSLRHIPSSAPRRQIKYGLMEGIRYAFACLRYPSQLRTWLGLFPEAFVRRVIFRVEFVTQFQRDRVMARPHEGRLLYERLFSTRYSELSDVIAPLRQQILKLVQPVRRPTSVEK